MSHITLWLFLIILLCVIVFVPYKLKILEDFQASCNCDDLNNQINKLQGDVMNYQQRASETQQKCESDKNQIQAQTSAERTKLTSDTANAKVEVQEKDQKIKDLKIEVDKLERSKVSLMDENKQLRDDYKIIYNSLTKTIDYAQTCHTNVDKQRVTLAESTNQLNNSSSFLSNIADKNLELVNRYVNECYKYNSSSMNKSDLEKERQTVVKGLTPEKTTTNLQNSKLLLSSSDNKYKIYKDMTKEQINLMMQDITADKSLSSYEKNKLLEYLKSLSPTQ